MEQKNRIIIVDALRGFALLLIILIHYIEHFELFAPPESRWLIPESVDNTIFSSIMFLVGGKAYSIFALMFGLSFFIQLNRAEQRGVDFRGKFAWRLSILLVMGFFHSLIYKGDILLIYALMGFLLLPLYKLKIKHLIIIGSIFILQIPSIIQVIQAYIDPNYTLTRSFGWGMEIWKEVDKTYINGSFWDVIGFNLWTGRTTVWGWTFYTGRYLQLFGLFIVGLIIGKTKFFENLEKHRGLLKKVLIFSPIAFAAFFLGRMVIVDASNTEVQKSLIGGLLNMYANIAFTLFYISGLIMLHLRFRNSNFINSLAIYGKMSLSNYVSQAVCGVIFFYGFGFGLYKYIGAGWSLLMGVAFFILQIQISKYWIKRYHYGPLEWLWRAITLFDFGVKLKRDEKIELKPAYIKVKK